MSELGEREPGRREPKHSQGWRGLGKVLGLRDFLYLRTKTENWDRTTREVLVGGRAVLRYSRRNTGHSWDRELEAIQVTEYQKARELAAAAKQRYSDHSKALREMLAQTASASETPRVEAREDGALVIQFTKPVENTPGRPEVSAIKFGKADPENSWQDQPVINLSVMTVERPSDTEYVGVDERGRYVTTYRLWLAHREQIGKDGLDDGLLRYSQSDFGDQGQRHGEVVHYKTYAAIYDSQAAMLGWTLGLLQQSPATAPAETGSPSP